MNKSAQAIQKLMLMLLLLMFGVITALTYSFTMSYKDKELNSDYIVGCGVIDEPCPTVANLVHGLDTVIGSEANQEHGKELFLANCASCHSVDMKKDLTGPALGDCLDNWNRDTSRLYPFIRNSQKAIADGDSYADSLYQEWGSVMTPFPGLSQQDLDDIIAFIYTKGPCG